MVRAHRGIASKLPKGQWLFRLCLDPTKDLIHPLEQIKRPEGLGCLRVWCLWMPVTATTRGCGLRSPPSARATWPGSVPITRSGHPVQPLCAAADPIGSRATRRGCNVTGAPAHHRQSACLEPPRRGVAVDRLARGERGLARIALCPPARAAGALRYRAERAAHS